MLEHWLSDPARLISLMQQFAINQAFETTANGGIFAVNGPPGTGKTTLLQEFMAENIVRRARVLSSFRTASDGFQKEKLTVHFEGGRQASIVRLVPDLTGFEMIVASSNEWIDGYQGPSFSESALHFKAIDELVSVALQERGRLASTFLDQTGLTENNFVAQEKSALHKATSLLAAALASAEAAKDNAALLSCFPSSGWRIVPVTKVDRCRRSPADRFLFYLLQPGEKWDGI